MRDALDGLRALVTGGASGIGLATVLACQEAGARVAVMDLADPPGVSAGDGAGELVSVRADVTDEERVRAGVTQVAEQFGGLDILVNSAGVGAQ